MRQLQVLYEDNHVIVVNKSAGLATMGVAAEEISLADRVKSYLKVAYQKPGNVYLGVVSRLDRPVTGAIVFARTSKAAQRLTDQFRDHLVEKIYWALVPRGELAPQGRLVNWLRKDEGRQRMVVCRTASAEAVEAILTYEQWEEGPRWSWLKVRLQTGRKHQIRAQLSAAGAPIWGDARYGSQQRFPQGIALHAGQLGFRHPVRDEWIGVTAPLPPYWPPQPHGLTAVDGR